MVLNSLPKPLHAGISSWVWLHSLCCTICFLLFCGGIHFRSCWPDLLYVHFTWPDELFEVVGQPLSTSNYSRKRHTSMKSFARALFACCAFLKLRWNLFCVDFSRESMFCWPVRAGWMRDVCWRIVFAHVCDAYLELLRLSLLCRLVCRGWPVILFRLLSRTQLWYRLHMNTNTIGYPKPNNPQRKDGPRFWRRLILKD